MATPKEIKKKLELILPKQGKQTIVPFIHGVPGIGKSAVVKEVARERKLDVIDLRLSQHESSDIKGIPYPDSNNNISRWLPPEFIPFKTTKKFQGTKGILFLDEINRAAPDVLQTVFQLILDRRVGELEIMDEWHIVAAGNLGDEDGCDVIELDPALNNRFIHLWMEPDLKSWISWAEKNGVHEDIIGFIRSKPGYLYRKVKNKYDNEMLITPRSWEKFSDIIKQNPEHDIKSISLLLANDIIGPAAIHFIKYIEEKNIIEPKKILQNYSEVEDKLKLMSREQIYALNSELANYIVSLKSIRKTWLANFHKYINNILEEDIKIAILQSIATKEKNGFLEKFFYEYEDEATKIIESFTKNDISESENK